VEVELAGGAEAGVSCAHTGDVAMIALTSRER
jgi:hypothetical protein